MSPSDAQRLAASLTSMFPRWKAEAAEVQAWIENVFAKQNVDVAQQAIGIYFSESRFANPSPADYRAVYARLATQNQPQAQSNDDGPWFCGLGIQCSVTHPDFPGRAGWYVPIIFPRRPEIEPRMDALYRVAERTIEEYARCYGGGWVIINGEA